jgi:hypothetical protein
MRGNASESVVVGTERVADMLAYAFCAGLLVLLCGGAYELSRAKGLPLASRVVAVGSAGLVIALAAPSLAHRLHAPLALALAIAATVTALAAGITSFASPHTRWTGVVIVGLALAALARLLAWELATVAGERASIALYNASRGLATAGLVVECVSQIVARRTARSGGRWVALILMNLALVGAVVVTWGAARGSVPEAKLWQSILYTALADTPGTPAPSYALSPVAVFLVPSAIFHALAVAVQPKRNIAVLAALSLGLLSRGAFDVPLRALAVAVAAHWLLLARSDRRAMWTDLQREHDERAGADGTT